MKLSKMIQRQRLLADIERGIKKYPITAILGPRQCGKTTLAKSLRFKSKPAYFDLENPEDFNNLQNPMGALAALKGLVVIDEIQRDPKLFEVLRVLADRRPLPARFLILGSASPHLMKGSSESLAGRIHFVDMAGFVLQDVGADRQERLWVRGAFPDSFLAASERESVNWRENFIRSFLERDIPQLGIRVPAAMLRRFWTMVAHYHGQTWNASDIGSSMGVSHVTARQYLDTLSGAFMVRQLAPWFENTGKRVVRSPKAYIRDTGLLHSLLGVVDRRTLHSHPKMGASWEGFVLEQILSVTGDRQAYFWATHSGAELDLLIFLKGKRIGVEIKYADAPKVTRSMHVAMADLKLDRLMVVHPGEKSYPLDKKIDCITLSDALDHFRKVIS